MLIMVMEMDIKRKILCLPNYTLLLMERKYLIGSLSEEKFSSHTKMKIFLRADMMTT